MVILLFYRVKIQEITQIFSCILKKIEKERKKEELPHSIISLQWGIFLHHIMYCTLMAMVGHKVLGAHLELMKWSIRHIFVGSSNEIELYQNVILSIMSFNPCQLVGTWCFITTHQSNSVHSIYNHSRLSAHYWIRFSILLVIVSFLL